MRCRFKALGTALRPVPDVDGSNCMLARDGHTSPLKNGLGLRDRELAGLLGELKLPPQVEVSIGSRPNWPGKHDLVLVSCASLA